MIKILLVVIVILFIIIFISHKNLPDNSQRSLSQYLPVNPQGLLAKHLLPQIAKNPELTGVYSLNDSHEAFLARFALVETAQYSLDVQYYIWHNDISGHLLMQSLYRAAERGVRVRLLLDDNNTGGMDSLLASVNHHPNIEVRLFNPFMQRNFRPLGYLSDFFRLNRRMHNKSLTADSLATIVGGRNIGDEYFGAGSGVLFADLDVMAVGNVVQQVEQDFDRYWASESSYPLENIIQQQNNTNFDATPSQDIETQNYLKALAQSSFAVKLREGGLPLIWSKAQLVSDDPAKGLGKALSDNTVLAHISPVMASAKQELVIVSPYFVPTQQGTDLLINEAKNKQVTILTNSLAATDVAPVHAGYAKYRKDLLQGGIQLFELKPNATVHMTTNGILLGNSGASLHAKTFTVDNRYLFVGSFNMDPRSVALNTEMGIILDNPQLASMLSTGLKQHQAEHTYDVSLNNQGDLHWQTQEQGQSISFDTEPQSNIISRLVVSICALLPIEWLL